jgi:hypothetical protein
LSKKNDPTDPWIIKFRGKTPIDLKPGIDTKTLANDNTRPVREGQLNPKGLLGIDELSKETLSSYLRKAVDHNRAIKNVGNRKNYRRSM